MMKQDRRNTFTSQTSQTSPVQQRPVRVDERASVKGGKHNRRPESSPELEEGEDYESVVNTCRGGFKSVYGGSRKKDVPVVTIDDSPPLSDFSARRPIIQVSELQLSREVETVRPGDVQKNVPRILHGKRDTYESGFQRRDTVPLDQLLADPSNLPCIAPVIFFPNAPLARIWCQIALPGLKMELRNPFINGTDEYYWLSTVSYYAGYRALVKFDNFDTSDTVVQHLSWISFCSATPKYLGWCADNGKELNHGGIVSNDLPVQRFVEEIVKVYEAKLPTVRSDHVDIISRAIQAMVTYELGEIVEAIDVQFPSRCRLGKIVAIVGDRVQVKYLDREGKNMDGIWCTERSQMIFPLGWCYSVGASLFADIHDERMNSALSLDFIPKYPENLTIKSGMRFEARHPVLHHKIVGAMVRKVLKFGYFIMETRDESIRSRIKSIVHVTSPFLYPTGWAKQFPNCKVESSHAYNTNIHEYLNLKLLPKRLPHNFSAGLIVEAIHHLEPSVAVCATVVDVADHMLLVRYDSSVNITTKFSDLEAKSNEAWVDIGENIYPVGYSELVGLNTYHMATALPSYS